MYDGVMGVGVGMMGDGCRGGYDGVMGVGVGMMGVWV